jgi:hypothetical protein
MPKEVYIKPEVKSETLEPGALSCNGSEVCGFCFHPRHHNCICFYCGCHHDC